MDLSDYVIDVINGASALAEILGGSDGIGANRGDSSNSRILHDRSPLKYHVRRRVVASILRLSRVEEHSRSVKVDSDVPALQRGHHIQAALERKLLYEFCASAVHVQAQR